MKKESNRLFDIRMKLGITQQTMADMLGVAKNYVYLMEAGKKPVTETVLEKLDKLDGVQIRTKKAAYQTNRNGIIPGSINLQESIAPYGDNQSQCPNCELLQIELSSVTEQLKRANAMIDILIKKEQS